MAAFDHQPIVFLINMPLDAGDVRARFRISPLAFNAISVLRFQCAPTSAKVQSLRANDVWNLRPELSVQLAQATITRPFS